MTIHLNSAFSWSHSRDKTLLNCARKYYWQYYGSHGGWRDDAPEEARLAFRLKHLTTLHLVLGTVVHNLARERVLAMQVGQPLLSFEEMLQRARAELNAVCLASHHRDQFIRYPARNPMLCDVWYNGERNEAVVERVREKMVTCLRALADCPLWEELRALPPESILLVEQMSTFREGDVAVFAAPDVVYTPRPCNIIIGDWKTGSEDGADLQLALYALYLVQGRGFEFVEGAWQGRVMNLSTGDDVWYDISGNDLARAAERIRESIAAMRADLADPEANTPLTMESFPLAPSHRRAQCGTCNFHQLCAHELRRDTLRQLRQDSH